MLYPNNGIVAHHGTNDLHGVINADNVIRFADNGVALGLDDFGLWVDRRRHRCLGVICKLLVFPNHILFADFLKAVIGAFQQVGQHLLDRFIGTGIAIDADFAQFRLAEGHIQFVIGKEFFQGFVQATRLDRERNQRVECLGLRLLRTN